MHAAACTTLCWVVGSVGLRARLGRARLVDASPREWPSPGALYSAREGNDATPALSPRCKPPTGQPLPCTTFARPASHPCLCQTLENAYLRASLGMVDGLSGVLVNRVQPTSPTARVLAKGDVLLAFDGVTIAK